jgi:ribosomal protein S18 acetylase RimI-like enzyme
MSSLSVIEADLSDPLHQDAIREMLDHYARDPMGNGAPLAPDILERLIPGLVEHPRSLVFLALDPAPARSALGIAICFVGFSTFAGRPLINIHDFAVRSGRRGQGIGRALLTAVEARGRELGCCKLTLEVRHDNQTAQLLYKRFGFGDFGAGPAAGDFWFWSKTLVSGAGNAE